MGRSVDEGQLTLFGVDAPKRHKKRRNDQELFRRDNNYRGSDRTINCSNCQFSYIKNNHLRCEPGGFMIDKLPMICNKWERKEEE